MVEHALHHPPPTLGEHFASTLTHALTCSVLDPATAKITSSVQKLLDKNFTDNDAKETTKEWLLGEVVGDFGSVPLVVMAQKFFPNLMNGTANALEPIVKHFFQNSSEKSAKNWAVHHHVEIGSERYHQKKEELLARAISNFPKTLLWTVSSTAINIGMQRFVLENKESPVVHQLAAKAIAAITTGAAVTLVRAFAPDTTRNFERFVHHKAIKPIGQKIKEILDGKKPDEHEHNHEHHWQTQSTQMQPQIAR